MPKQIEAGFFVMEDVNAITKMGLHEAQSYLVDVIDKFREKHPNVKEENIRKAAKMIFGAHRVDRLAIDVSNFILAHPSENLKTIR